MIALLLIIIMCVLLFGKEEVKSTIGGIFIMFVVLGLIGMIFC